MKVDNTAISNFDKQKYIDALKKVPYRDPSAIKLKKSSAFKFSNSDRDPTFLYTRSPFTFMNEKIKKQKQIRRLEKGW